MASATSDITARVIYRMGKYNNNLCVLCYCVVEETLDEMCGRCRRIIIIRSQPVVNGGMLSDAALAGQTERNRLFLETLYFVFCNSMEPKKDWKF